MEKPLRPDSTTHVAFFRKMNLGRQGASHRRVVYIVDAFATAGAERVVDFQTTLTRMLGVPVTCRGIPSMMGLAHRL